ncbi:hypothetical protein [Cellulomonas taurus]|uniref:hypothetical protein n=1 Tax=Cellulomonas taurus TaxID=2729175 RepID=UPI00145DD1EC|nr:hypothetical protein [Cellulomonas taurus]
MDSTHNTRGRAKLRLLPEDLSEILDLPEHTHVVAVQTEIDPLSIKILIEGPGLPECVPGTEAPYLHRTIEQTSPTTQTVRWA